MTCYVDGLRDHGWVLRGHRVKSCHLFSDEGPEELHALAEQIGMKRAWFQAPVRRPFGGPSLAHYDLTAKRRRAAIEAGAVELTTRQELQAAFQRTRDAWATLRPHATRGADRGTT